eukprot:gene33144-44366_t
MVENGARFGGSSKRMSLLKEHRAYQAETVSPTSPTYIRKISAGPLVGVFVTSTISSTLTLESDDGKFMVGSAFIVESTREEVDRFIAGDPFHQNGMENHDLSTVTM